MFLAEIMSFRDIAVTLIGELSPSMYFMYDIIACILFFLFFLVILSIIVFTKRIFK
jgi:hypothetical protein